LSIPAAGASTPNKVWAFAKAGAGNNLLNLKSDVSAILEQWAGPVLSCERAMSY
jgi:hypothetical protein